MCPTVLLGTSSGVCPSFLYLCRLQPGPVRSAHFLPTRWAALGSLFSDCTPCSQFGRWSTGAFPVSLAVRRQGRVFSLNLLLQFISQFGKVPRDFKDRF